MSDSLTDGAGSAFEALTLFSYLIVSSDFWLHLFY